MYKQIEQLPPHLTEEEYYNKFLFFLKEDYTNEVRKLVNFEDMVYVDLKRPNEDIAKPVENTRYAILLDASGSMNGQVNGISKMAAAKKSIEDFARDFLLLHLFL